MLSFGEYLQLIERAMTPSAGQELALNTKYVTPAYKSSSILAPKKIPGGTVDKNLFKPTSNLGVDRKDMPQVDNQGFLRWLISLGIGVERVHVKPSSLTDSNGGKGHFAQAFMYLDKTDKKLSKKTVLKDLIIITKDNIVFDGNHRWLSLMRVVPDVPMPMFQVNMDFSDLYKLTTTAYPNVRFEK